MLKPALEKLVAQAKQRDLDKLSEEHVQSSYTLKVLEALGWNDGGWIINTSQKHTGKRPDIVLKDAKGWTMLVIEGKDCKDKNKLDGYDTVQGKKRTYQEQVINYCKAEGVYWGVLTNFVEWRLYNAHRGILYPQNKKYAFHDLLWDGADKKEYTNLLSKDGLAFLAQFARKPLCKKLGMLDDGLVYYPEEKQIRDDFFSRLKVWREALRDELWSKNQHLITDKEKVELYTQKILDRMIFMDVCHDKRIVGPDGHRAILYTQDSVYAELRKWFEKMDELFNTDLFAQDDKIDKFVISNEVLSPIVEELSAIDFSRLPVRIIGDVYEDYLGEMLRGGKVQGLQVQDDKARGKRKSQGIYYTPEYIVDYITTNTVGELLNHCHTEADIKKIRALDPACGSGSFLINAFDKFYQAYKQAGVVARLGDFAVKKTILQHNLYGVDLDDRAVEICKLNLMLKALDGAKWEELKGRKLLPSLELNIRCGNSLISGKSFADKAKENPQMSFVGPYDADKDVEDLLKLRKKFYKAKEDGEKKDLLAQIKRDEEVINSKLNDNLRKSFARPSEQKPLNYEVVFPEVFEQGGFDAVIGNPPYGAELSDDQRKYFETRSVLGNTDTAALFLDQQPRLSKQGGITGFIVPKPFIYASNWAVLRTRLISEITTVVDVGQVWPEVKLEQVVILFIKGSNKKLYISLTRDGEKIYKLTDIPKQLCEKYGFIINGVKTEEIGIADKMTKDGYYLGSFILNQRGGMLQQYITDVKHACSVLGGMQINRYSVEQKPKGYIAQENIKDTNAKIQPNSILIQNIIAHIQNPVDHIKIIATISKGDDCVILDTVNQFTNNSECNEHYILGILNSKLISWYVYRFIFGKAIRTMHFDAPVTSRIPYPMTDLKNKTHKHLYEQITRLVKEMLSLNKTPESRERNATKIAALDKQIDQLVYRLYGLSEKEKQIVESK